MKLFTDDMANKIKEFVDLNKDKKEWIIHCVAGISRSGAIGLWLTKYLGYNLFEFLENNPIESQKKLPLIFGYYYKDDSEMAFQIIPKLHETSIKEEEIYLCLMEIRNILDKYKEIRLTAAHDNRMKLFINRF